MEIIDLWTENKRWLYFILVAVVELLLVEELRRSSDDDTFRVTDTI